MYNKEQLISWRNLIYIMVKTIDRVLKLPSVFISTDNRDMQIVSMNVKCKGCKKSYVKPIYDNKREMINLNRSKCPLCFKDNSFKTFIVNTN